MLKVFFNLWYCRKLVKRAVKTKGMTVVTMQVADAPIATRNGGEQTSKGSEFT